MGTRTDPRGTVSKCSTISRAVKGGSLHADQATSSSKKSKAEHKSKHHQDCLESSFASVIGAPLEHPVLPTPPGPSDLSRPVQCTVQCTVPRPHVISRTPSAPGGLSDAARIAWDRAAYIASKQAAISIPTTEPTISLQGPSTLPAPPILIARPFPDQPSDSELSLGPAPAFSLTCSHSPQSQHRYTPAYAPPAQQWFRYPHGPLVNQTHMPGPTGIVGTPIMTTEYCSLHFIALCPSTWTYIGLRRAMRYRQAPSTIGTSRTTDSNRSIIVTG